MGLGVSVEVQLIYYYIAAVMFIITIFNMLKINKLIKINKDLDKESDDYKINIKKIKKVFYISFIFIMIMEGIYCFFATFMSSCNCGHYPVKLFPIITCLILTFVANIFIFRTLKDEDYTASTLVVFVLLPIVIFISTVLLSRNNLDALHSL